MVWHDKQKFGAQNFQLFLIWAFNIYHYFRCRSREKVPSSSRSPISVVSLSRTLSSSTPRSKPSDLAVAPSPVDLESRSWVNIWTPEVSRRRSLVITLARLSRRGLVSYSVNLRKPILIGNASFCWFTLSASHIRHSDDKPLVVYRNTLLSVGSLSYVLNEFETFMLC